MGDLVVTDNAHYSAIANAIRTKNGTENTYTPAQMAPAILALPTASGGYVYQDEQGFVVLDDDGDGPQLTTTTVTPTESEQIVSPTGGYDGFSQVTVGAIDSEYVGSDVNRNSSSDLTASGATVTAPAGYYAEAASKSVATATHSKPSVSINSSTGVVTASHAQTAGYVSAGTTSDTLSLTTQAAKTVTPTESEQTAVAAGRYTTGAVKVGAISSTYVGSGIEQRDETDLTASGATVTVPAGYYAEQETKSVATTTHQSPTASVNSTTGLVTASHTQGTGYVTGGTTTGTLQLTTQAAKTVTPTETEQVAVAAGRYTTGQVKVAAISSTYVGSGIAQRDETDLTASGATVTVPAGYYAEQETKSVASGTAGTPTATKGTVSGNAITVTPSVSNTTGWITGGTVTGNPVSVSASEVVSGDLAITTNDTYNVTNYASVTVNVPSGSVSVEPLSVTSNGTYTAPTGIAYSPVTVNVSGGGVEEKDVNFIDYDGTILHSYSASEAQALTALPENPSHTGLVAQGWNWSLADIKSQLTNVGDVVWVGQMYATESGASEIDIELDDPEYLAPYLTISLNGSVSVDWGDNSAPTIVTGNSVTSLTYTRHVYAQIGSYTISITDNSGVYAFYNNNSAYGSVLNAYGSNNTRRNSRLYSNKIKRIRIGAGATIRVGAFDNCCSLETITIPNNITSIGTFYNCWSIKSITIPYNVNSIPSTVIYCCYDLKRASIPHGITSVQSACFSGCYALESVTIPEGIATLSANMFSNCYALKKITISSNITNITGSAFYNCFSVKNITIPNSVTTIGSSAFSSCLSLETVNIPDNITSIESSVFATCRSLKNIVIPVGVTSIGNGAFNNCNSLSSLIIPETVTSIGTTAFGFCYGVEEYHLLPTTPPTLAGTNAFNGIVAGTIIYVPQGCLEAYQTATNWSTYASYMQEEP